jgi:hypothetical protein
VAARQKRAKQTADADETAEGMKESEPAHGMNCIVCHTLFVI